MGGRGRKEKKEQEEEDSYGRYRFLKEVSNDRLLAYGRMLESGGRKQRLSGEFRSGDTREVMGNLIRKERIRRGI